MKINDLLLNKFIHTFYGAGNHSGKYWFIGMEEGGGDKLEEVINRLSVWKDLGEEELVDTALFHLGLEEQTRFFSDPVKLQRTWMQLIRMILIAEGEHTSIADLKNYQRDRLGRKDQDTCILEVLPLCSPNTSTWRYAEWSDLPFLKNRETYRNYCRDWRCSHLRSQIKKFQPALVVFYSSGYQKWWQEVAGLDISFQEDSGVWHCVSGKTLFIITQHPAARGIKNAYFEKVGSIIQSFQQSK